MFVESCVRPVAVHTRTPRFSWQLPLTGRGRSQSAYRILVASDRGIIASGNADIWDSGRVESTQSAHVPYAGPRLESDSDYFWSVELWDERREKLPTRPAEPFSTPLFDPDDWTADWIGLCDPNEPFPDPAVYQHECVPPEVQAFEPDARSPMMCREFEVEKPVARARVYVCGVGLFELRLNGDKVGDDMLATPRTDFRTRVLYSTYDVTDQVRTGANALGVMLGNGWYNGQKKYWGWQYQWHGSPRAIVQLEITFIDGTRRRIVSDGSWKGTFSAITSNCLYDGERYDARLEQCGWDTPGFDRSRWQAVNKVPGPGGVLRPIECAPSRVTERIRPVRVVYPETGVAVYDFGRNITGWAQLRVKDAPAGTTIKLHYAEAQYPDGRLNPASNNRAEQADHYTCKGGGAEAWKPRFTFHGFQFVEVTGYPGTPDLETLEAHFVRDHVEQTGTFACSDELINKIHRCTVQSLLCNIQMGVPTDDTQRTERLGWGADAWAYSVAGFYNLDMSRVFTKWFGDYRDQQDELGAVGMITPQAGWSEDLVWSAAFVLIPWWQYLHCGDRGVLEQNYPALQRYLSFLERVGIKDVRPMATADLHKRLLSKSGKAGRLPAEADRGYLQISQWGDHLATNEGYVHWSNAPLSIATVFYYLDVVTLARIADVLGHADDAKRYRELAEKINQAYHERFFDPVFCRYDIGIQSAQAWPLAFGMVPQEHRERVQRELASAIGNRQRRLTTGYTSTRFAIHVLADMDRHDLIWKLATQTTYPSWGYMLRLNRTSACERWDGEGGSLNHAALCAAIDEWFYWGLAGIRPDESAPGYERIVFKPYMPADLPWAQASIRTLRGVIRSSWRRTGDAMRLEIEVPPNSTGIVHIPCADASKILESDRAPADAQGVVSVQAGEKGSVVYVGSGSYRFTFPAV